MSPVKRTLVICAVLTVVATALLLWMETWFEQVVESQTDEATAAPDAATPRLGVQVLAADGGAAIGARVEVRWRSGDGSIGTAAALAAPTNIVRIPLVGADDRCVLLSVRATLDEHAATLGEEQLVRVRPDGRVRVTLR